jgi:hypothetical protein
MSREKSPFEKTAAALKIMGKKISAKKGTGSNILKCVFVPNRTAHAIATDGRVAAVLDLNQYEDFSKIDVLQELAFYADMQVLNYLNGRALVTAEKKEEFVMEYGLGLDNPSYEKLEDTELPYPNLLSMLPPAESLQNVSATGATFRPGEIGVLDSVADAFGVLPIVTETIANILYGAEAEGCHIATLSGLMLVAWPLRQNKHDIEVVPSKAVIQSYFAESEIENNKEKEGEN